MGDESGQQVATIERVLQAVVAAVAIVTAIGLIALWPDRSVLPAADEPVEPLVLGAIVELVVVDQTDFGGEGFGATDVLDVTIDLLDGPDAGETITIEVFDEGLPELAPGDEVLLNRSDIGAGESIYSLIDLPRTSALWWLVALFVVAVLAVSRLHGLRALLGLAFSLGVIVWFVLPAILTGTSPFAVAIIGALAVMIVTLYVTHGFNVVTTSAVVGTSLALALTIVLALIFVDTTRLTGLTSEEALLASYAVDGLDLRAMVLAGMLIATLGVLDDVTVSQASTVFQLHAAAPTLGRASLAARAMRVGRDHIASTVNTLFLAYAGASLATLLVFSTSSVAVGELLNSEVVAEEIVKTLVGSLGLIVAVPLTTLIAAIAVTSGARAGAGHGHAHGHTHGHAHEHDGGPGHRGAASGALDAGPADAGDTVVDASAPSSTPPVAVADAEFEAWLGRVRPDAGRSAGPSAGPHTGRQSDPSEGHPER